MQAGEIGTVSPVASALELESLVVRGEAEGRVGRVRGSPESTWGKVETVGSTTSSNPQTGSTIA